MNKVFLIHGFEGSPNGGWRPWVMAELEKKGVYACSLAMPSPNNPLPSEWIEEISRHIDMGTNRDHVYLVGHSLGVPAILRYLESKDAKKIHGAVLISGPSFKTTKKKVDRFFTTPFDFKTIKSKVGTITVIHGDTDRSVPIEQGRFLAKELDAELIVVKNGGHLNGAAGWNTLPQCLSALIKMMR
jgi:predicted alpha/beta hydrolase family esterase